jgi:hypothetical protein
MTAVKREVLHRIIVDDLPDGHRLGFDLQLCFPLTPWRQPRLLRDEC